MSSISLFFKCNHLLLNPIHILKCIDNKLLFVYCVSAFITGHQIPFPILFLGISSTTLSTVGILYGAIFSFIKFRKSFSFNSFVSFVKVTIAATRCPHYSSSKPTTATSSMLSKLSNSLSTSSAEIL
jgi:hypothetical protein